MIPSDTVPSRPSGLPITATRDPTSAIGCLEILRNGTSFASACRITKSLSGAAFSTPRMAYVAPFSNFAVAVAAPSITCELVISFPSLDTKKPVPVLTSFPELSETLTRATAGRVALANFLTSKSCGVSGGVTSDCVVFGFTIGGRDVGAEDGCGVAVANKLSGKRHNTVRTTTDLDCVVRVA